MPGKRWTPEEEQFLIEHWNKMSYQAIGEHLGRNPRSLHGKALRLGLSIAPKTMQPRKSGWRTWAAKHPEYTPPPKDYKALWAKEKARRTLSESRVSMKKKPGRLLMRAGWVKHGSM